MSLTAREIASLRLMINEHGIRRTVELYFHAVDAYDWELLASLFTDDGILEFKPNPREKNRIQGGRNIAAYIEGRNGFFKAKTHRISHMKITVDEDRAECDTFAVSDVVLNDGRIAVRGLRYDDHLIRGSDGAWRFTMRYHRSVWQHYALAVEPEVPHT